MTATRSALCATGRHQDTPVARSTDHCRGSESTPSQIPGRLFHIGTRVCGCDCHTRTP